MAPGEVDFGADADLKPSRVLLPARASGSPVVQVMVRARLVPSERAARLAVVVAAALGVGGAFTSIYLSTPDRGEAGARYESLSAAERAEVPAAERAYLEHVELLRRERAAAEVAD